MLEYHTSSYLLFVSLGRVMHKKTEVARTNKNNIGTKRSRMFVFDRLIDFSPIVLHLGKNAALI